MLEDGSLNPGGMTSFNHYALGAIADWLQRVVAGLAPTESGYHKIAIQPCPLPGLDHASATHETPYGRATVNWRRHATHLSIEAVIPPNTTATVTLPGQTRPFTVGSGQHSWTVNETRQAHHLQELSLTSAMAQIIDDPDAYQALLDAFDQHQPGSAREFTKHTKWTPGRYLREAVNRAPHDVVEQISRAFKRLNQSRGATTNYSARASEQRTSAPGSGQAPHQSQGDNERVVAERTRDA
jgi:alpha-L-rhamnosidase